MLGLVWLGLVVGALALGPPAASAEVATGLAPSTLRTVKVAFPQGVSISPSAADGLTACSDEQLGLGSPAPAQCPNASKIGSVEVTTPALTEKLTGGIFVRTSTPSELIRVALVARASFSGIVVKLPGSVQLDQSTGQVTATFDSLPQLPFSDMHLDFFGGPRAVFANPPDCGSYAVQSVLTPWSGQPPVVQSSLFRVGLDADAPCPTPLPFDLTASGGTVNPVAGASTPFVLRVQRPDDNQELGRIAVDLPAGLSAAPRDVPLCPSAQADHGACGEDSRIGTIVVGSGPGPDPLYLRGKIYLTDSYRGAPFGLALVVPAIAGPFDLGTVVVRSAVNIDPGDAHLSIVSDTLPRILEGIPLRLRDIQLQIDRPGFMRNPTNCTPSRVRFSIDAVQGARSTSASRFQVGDCAALRFAPHLSVSLTGRGPATADRPLGLRARLHGRRGDANLRSVAFTLPPDVAFDALLRHPLCTRPQLAARSCPPKTRIGTASATTTLLAHPLSGPVYFVRGVKGDPFPKLAMLLNGQVQIDLLGSTSVSSRGLLTSFGLIPDVPVTDFTLNLDRGILTPTDNLCTHRPSAAVNMRAQNGKRRSGTLRVGVPCRPSSRRHRRHQRHRVI